VKEAHVGCSGWNYRDWRGRFYPRELPVRQWLEAYSREFPTVEVNSTFYRLTSREAVANWVAQTPPGFIFALKASRYLTHVKRLVDIGGGISRFYEPLEPLRAAERMGPVLWQLPENFTRDDARLANALELLPAGRHAFEFRHASWFTPAVYRMLREHEAALVIADHPERRFQTEVRTAPWRYVRLHCGTRGRRGNYSRAELEHWARRVQRWRARDEVFVYFNNDREGFAPRNAARMLRHLERLAETERS
jgi:uncharacterized protein YecE (DUF72 family)